jgi:hypothetical protein
MVELVEMEEAVAVVALRQQVQVVEPVLQEMQIHLRQQVLMEVTVVMVEVLMEVVLLPSPSSSPSVLSVVALTTTAKRRTFESA